MSSGSRNSQLIALSEEILADIELSRISADKIAFKTIRLARLANASDEIQNWLDAEVHGYDFGNEEHVRFAKQVGRYDGTNPAQSWTAPLAQIDAAIEADKMELQQLKLPNLSTNYAAMAIYNVQQKMDQLTVLISRFQGTLSRVLAKMHFFCSSIYYELVFSNLSETIFEQYKSQIDTILAEKAGEVLKRIPAISERLFQNDNEAVSHAMSSCRRLIVVFADAVFPPSSEPYMMGEERIEVTADKVKNRINAYISSKVTSDLRRKRLRQNLGNVFETLSKGVHDDVTADEARALLLTTYLLLGEVITL